MTNEEFAAVKEAFALICDRDEKASDEIRRRHLIEHPEEIGSAPFSDPFCVACDNQAIAAERCARMIRAAQLVQPCCTAVLVPDVANDPPEVKTEPMP